jgi:TonB family protein
MNRGDLRLGVAIAGTAAAAAILTGALLTAWSSTTALEVRLHDLQIRVGALEVKASEDVCPTVEPPAPAPEPPPAPVLAGECDEVRCVLEDYAPACCAKFGKPRAAGPPEALDREMIADGVGLIRPRVAACGVRDRARGKVQVVVEVAPSGEVTRATVVETPGPALGACVVRAMTGARFAPTRRGGVFRYPFVF